jgi:hypothetical protein
MELKFSDILKDVYNDDVDKAIEILNKNEEKENCIIREAFDDDFTSKETAIYRIQYEFLDNVLSPKTVDKDYLKENMDQIIKKIETMTEGDIKIIIHNDSNKSGGGVNPMVSYEEGAKRRGRPKKGGTEEELDETKEMYIVQGKVKKSGKIENISKPISKSDAEKLKDSLTQSLKMAIDDYKWVSDLKIVPFIQETVVMDDETEDEELEEKKTSDDEEELDEKKTSDDEEELDEKKTSDDEEELDEKKTSDDEESSMKWEEIDAMMDDETEDEELEEKKTSDDEEDLEEDDEKEDDEKEDDEIEEEKKVDDKKEDDEIEESEEESSEDSDEEKFETYMKSKKSEEELDEKKTSDEEDEETEE